MIVREKSLTQENFSVNQIEIESNDQSRLLADGAPDDRCLLVFAKPLLPHRRRPRRTAQSSQRLQRQSQPNCNKHGKAGELRYVAGGCSLIALSTDSGLIISSP